MNIEKLKSELISQKNSKFKGNIYHYSQVNFAYNSNKIEDIIEFHYRFEKIHPFGDGNGRVGRMIMFKECLKNNIMPFIVLDNDKPFYLRGLKNYENDKMFLIDTVKHEQDLYEIAVNDMLDFEI